jgi:hypothetical protein
MLKNSSTILIYYNLPVYTFNISYNINLCYKSHLLLIQQPNRKRQNLPLWECQTWVLVDSSRVWPQLDLKNFGSTRLDRSELDEGLNSMSLNRSEIWKARLGSTRLASCRGVTPKVAVEQNFQCVLSGTVSGAGISQPTGSSTHNVMPKMPFDSLNKFIMGVTLLNWRSHVQVHCKRMHPVCKMLSGLRRLVFYGLGRITGPNGVFELRAILDLAGSKMNRTCKTIHFTLTRDTMHSIFIQASCRITSRIPF